MKIRQLHINRFGHFNECGLVFPGDGLQVIYGPNEAGKTTLLEFLRGLLFDFPPRTPYDFGGQGDVAGVATLELRDGRSVELRRRKGNKDKVAIKLDGRPTDLDDSGWLRLLDHADRGLFESVFAFGLDQLGQGEASLKHESLQSALFGASLGGLSSPDKMVADLSRQADVLFKKAGRTNPKINVLLNELAALKKEIKARLLRPAKYHDAELTLAKAADHAQALHQQVDQLRQKHSKIEKQVRACPKWWELQQKRSERASLIIPAQLPLDARQRYLAASKELKSIADEQLKRTEVIKQAEQSLAALKLDPGAISYRTEIKSCIELRQSFIEAKEQLPERVRQREAMRQLIDRELIELRPGWNHDDLRAFSVDVATRSEIDRLSEERRERTTSHTKFSTKRDGDVTSLERAREDLAEIGPLRDVTAIASVLADESDFVANRKHLAITQTDLSKLERKLAVQCRKLTPPLSDVMSAPHELPVPRAETISEFETLFASVSQQCQAVVVSVEEDEAEQRVIEQSLTVAISSHVVPSLDERDAARDRRDVGWGLVRQKYISSEHSDSAIAAWLDAAAATSLPDGYEQAVRVADNIADQIYDNANEVAKREGLRRQLTTLATRLDQKRQRIAELERQKAELKTKWFNLWRPCGFEPLAPEAMLAWLNDHEAVCAMITQREDLIEEQSTLAERVESFEQRLRLVYGQDGGDVLGVLASARLAVDDAKERQRTTTELQKEVRRLEKQLAIYDAELQTLVARETAADAQWHAVLSRLKLPGNWSTEVARTVIDKLHATRVRLDSLPGEMARIDAMQARIDEFDERVRALCQAIEPEMIQDPTELAIKKLDEQVERAVEAQRRHDECSQRLADARTQSEMLTQRQNQLDSELAHLFALADATTDAEFLEVVSQAEKAIRLDGEINQFARDIDLIRAGDNQDEFEQSLSVSELVVLQGQERDLGDQLKATELSRKLADGEEALARDALSRLDGSGEVALLTEELSRKRSLLAAEVDRYMPLVYAKHLLQTAVSRFEKDNQPEMITTISHLLGQMTSGKYNEFDRAGGGNQNILIRRSDGVERTPAQLSAGTREQLYLAIRIAYVLHYCEQNQPLPIVIDDALANFDDQRARQTLRVLASVSQHAQVLFFTCHAHMLDIARDAIPELVATELK